MIERGADTTVIEDEDCSMLHWAASRQYKDLFFDLKIRGAEEHLVNVHGETPFIVAMDHREFASLILNGEYGVDLTPPFPWSRSWVIYSPWWLSSTTGFKLLRRRIGITRVGKLANLDSKTLGGWTPLCHIAQLNSVISIQNMLKLSARIDQDSCPYRSALMAACHRKAFQAVKFLVRNGASIVYTNLCGQKSAVDAAKPSKHILH